MHIYIYIYMCIYTMIITNKIIITIIIFIIFMIIITITTRVIIITTIMIIVYMYDKQHMHSGAMSHACNAICIAAACNAGSKSLRRDIMPMHLTHLSLRGSTYDIYIYVYIHMCIYIYIYACMHI